MSDLDFDNNLQKVITVAERKRLKLELQELEESLSTPKKKKTNWLLVASVALLGSLGSYFLLFNTKVSPKELYAQNFRPYRNVVQPIVRGDENIDKKTIAFTYYEQKQYNEAFQLFDELVSKNLMDKNTLNFYMANALLELNRPVKAISLFLSLAEGNSKKWQKESL